MKKEKEIEEPTQNEATAVLEKAETVLKKRISRMLDGKPRVAAQDRLRELKEGIKKLKTTI